MFAGLLRLCDVAVTYLAFLVAGEMHRAGGNLRNRGAAVMPILSECLRHNKVADDKKDREGDDEQIDKTEEMSCILGETHRDFNFLPIVGLSGWNEPGWKSAGPHWLLLSTSPFHSYGVGEGNVCELCHTVIRMDGRGIPWRETTNVCKRDQLMGESVRTITKTYYSRINRGAKLFSRVIKVTANALIHEAILCLSVTGITSISLSGKIGLHQFNKNLDEQGAVVGQPKRSCCCLDNRKEADVIGQQEPRSGYWTTSLCGCSPRRG